MVRVFLILSILSLFLFAKDEKSVYETNCVNCHNRIPVTIDKYFYRYLLEYSSEKAVKKAMFDFLKNPMIETTVMPDSFIKRFGIKKRTKLSDRELNQAIDSYWEEYKVFGKLK